jgi:hypothetical protein
MIIMGGKPGFAIISFPVDSELSSLMLLFEAYLTYHTDATGFAITPLIFVPNPRLTHPKTRTKCDIPHLIRKWGRITKLMLGS